MTQLPLTRSPLSPTPHDPAPAGPGVTKLAAKMAHELNNPLDAVLRFVSLAQRKAKAGDYSDIDRHLADAQFGLQRMVEVLRELMDIGRQINDILARPAQLPLVDLIARATRTATAQAEQRRVSLVVKNLLASTLEPLYDLRVAQVLSNLLKNAVESSPEDGTVRIVVQSTFVGVPAITIAIEDAGPGIAPEMLPQLFTPFATTKPSGSGHGLGLVISRELVSSLQGDLTLANRPAPLTGCVATVTLPLTTTV